MPIIELSKDEVRLARELMAFFASKKDSYPMFSLGLPVEIIGRQKARDYICDPKTFSDKQYWNSEVADYLKINPATRKLEVASLFHRLFMCCNNALPLEERDWYLLTLTVFFDSKENTITGSVRSEWYVDRSLSEMPVIAKDESEFDAIFDELNSLGYPDVYLQFSGGGDEGYMDGDFMDGEDKKVGVASDEMYDRCNNLLNSNFAGYWYNDGEEGSIHFFPARRECKISWLSKEKERNETETFKIDLTQYK